MRRNFKAQLDRDRKQVFHNSREFAEIREIEYDGDYYKIPVVLDYEAAKDRKKPSSDHAEGIFLVDLVVYIDLDDINRIPRKGNQISIDGDLYNIVTVENRHGEIVLNLEAFTEFGGV